LVIKLIAKLLLGRKESFIRGIKIKSKLYIFNIERYVPIDERLTRYKAELEKKTL